MQKPNDLSASAQDCRQGGNRAKGWRNLSTLYARAGILRVQGSCHSVIGWKVTRRALPGSVLLKARENTPFYSYAGKKVRIPQLRWNDHVRCGLYG